MSRAMDYKMKEKTVEEVVRLGFSDKDKTKMLLDYLSGQKLGASKPAAEFIRTIFEFPMRCQLMACE